MNAERARREELPDNISDWADSELTSYLTERYAPTEIPPCRVCGGELSMQKAGGGEPTVWAHSHDANGEYLRTPEGGIDWEHYRKSEFVDRRRGGDPFVMDLIRRFQREPVSV